MPDREKVIRGLKCLSGNDGLDNCTGCEYIKIGSYAQCVYHVAEDALILLKEQDDEIKELRSIVEFWKEKALHT